MRRIIAGFVCALFALALSAGDGFGGRVKEVRTADLLLLDHGHGTWLVRLYGVVAPKEGPVAVEAKKFVENLVMGKPIHARFEGRHGDEMWAVVGAGEPGVDVGLELVRAGLARRDPKIDYKYGELSRAEEEARREKRGLWARGQ
jgi:endonuclease YncB( thermonuclease family)